MRLLAAALLLLVLTGHVSCNNSKVTNMSDTLDNQNKRAPHNVKSDSDINTQHAADVGSHNEDDDDDGDDDDYHNRSSFLGNHKSVDVAVDELTLRNNEVLFDASNNNSGNAISFGDHFDSDTVGDINWRNGSNSNSVTRSERRGNDYSELSLRNAAASAFRTLPRHQRAIAAMAEQKGLLQQSVGGERILRRGKRYLQFAKGSRVSWRTNGKNNILKSNTLWAYGYGFRVNFPFPGPDESRRPFFKRDVLHSLVDVLDGHGLDGRACILKSYCTAALDDDSNISGGMLFKMLKLIFTLKQHDKRHFPYLRLDNCKQILHSHCPLSFNSISPFTDDM